MPLIQNNIPLPYHLYGYCLNSFISDLPENPGEIEMKIVSSDRTPCVIFGVEAIPGYSFGFHILLNSGALYSQLPLHALTTSLLSPPVALQELVRWDTFGFNVSAVEYDYLRNLSVYVNLPNSQERGNYRFTFDFFDNGFSNEPSQHKHFHLIELDSGHFALQSNDFLRFNDPSFVDSQRLKANPCLRRNTVLYSAED